MSVRIMPYFVICQSHIWESGSGLLLCLNSPREYVDGETGLCALFAACMMPSADKQVNELMKVFEEGLYGQLKA